MRLMTCSGPALTEVMAEVRRDLGPDAVIISTGNRPGGGIEVRAAAEGPRFGEVKDAPRLRASRESETQRRARPSPEDDNHLAEILAFHGVPQRAAEALAKAARQFEDREVEKEYLAVVRGVPEADSGSIEMPIGPARASAVRFGKLSRG